MIMAGGEGLISLVIKYGFRKVSNECLKKKKKKLLVGGDGNYMLRVSPWECVIWL